MYSAATLYVPRNRIDVHSYILRCSLTDRIMLLQFKVTLSFGFPLTLFFEWSQLAQYSHDLLVCFFFLQGTENTEGVAAGAKR